MKRQACYVCAQASFLHRRRSKIEQRNPIKCLLSQARFTLSKTSTLKSSPIAELITVTIWPRLVSCLARA